MFASFDPTLALRDALRAKELLKSDWFKARWGDKVAIAKGERAESASEYYSNHGGMRFSTSVAGKATGWHADIQVVDDPIKPRDTKGGSEATGLKLEAAREWWSGTMATRKANPETFRRIVVMQRVHQADLTGVCLEGQGEGRYEHLCLPMEFDETRVCRTKVGGDRRTTEGELLWPERFPASEVAILRDPILGLGPYDYASQCQQHPVPKEGGIFGRAKFPTWDVLPESAQWLQSWDMRFIDSKSRGDFVVGGVWCWRDAGFYLVRVYRGRWGFQETIEAIDRATLEFPKATLKLVEAKANGHAVVEVLQSRVPGLVLVEPEGGKEARAHAVSPLFEAGNVFVPASGLGERWLPEYLAEMRNFPRGKFDDQVDMTSQALTRMKSGYSAKFVRAMHLASQNGA
jgi:predicted phage terminase large subunit-like protein